MPRYTIYPESFLPPNTFSPYLQVGFRLPFESRDPIYPASSLQLSFERSDDHQEFFLEQRHTARDVHHTNAGVCILRLERENVPKYALKRCQGSAAVVVEDAADVKVKLHAWKGDRHLGVWQVGTLRGEDIYKVVD